MLMHSEWGVDVDKAAAKDRQCSNSVVVSRLNSRQWWCWWWNCQRQPRMCAQSAFSHEGLNPLLQVSTNAWMTLDQRGCPHWCFWIIYRWSKKEGAESTKVCTWGLPHKQQGVSIVQTFWQMSPLFSRHKKIVLKMLGWFFVTKENNG